jgi:hypothetical protein
MPEKTMRDAINEALHQAMEQDESVFVIGEDVAGCNGSAGRRGFRRRCLRREPPASTIGGLIAVSIRRFLNPPLSGLRLAPRWLGCAPLPK